MSYTVLLTIEFLSYREDFLTAVEQVDWHVHVVRWTDCHSPLRQEDFRLEIELRNLQILLPGIFLPFCVLRGIRFGLRAKPRAGSIRGWPGRATSLQLAVT